MSNNFEVYSSPEGIKEFIKSSIDSSANVLEHYDFVINDISGKISDPQLEASKEPAVRFLFQMRQKWFEFKTSLENQLAALEKK